MKNEQYRYLTDLRGYAEELGVLNVAADILKDNRFHIATASWRPAAHHYGKGGLLRHTWEVCALCFQNATFYKSVHDIDMKVLFLAALFHDYGKVWDYRYIEHRDTYIPTAHLREIHHISRSAIEWAMIARVHKVDQALTDKVTHCILSHHGKREYGSPVAPFTREAWILHLSDNMSARVDDCDRIDLVKLKKQ